MSWVASSSFVAGSVMTGCGAPDEVSLASVSLPFALPVACADVPADLRAELWQAGTRAPIPLEVDLDEGTTSGRVEVTTGAVRRLVLDWYVEREHAGETVRVLLAQLTTELDLREPEATEIVLEIDPADVEVAACRDVRFDLTREGSETQPFAGEARPACDLDESCGGALSSACSNLGEICAGLDPLAE